MSNAVFPTLAGLTWNVLKSPRWSTRVQQSVGGKELRASFFSTPLYTWQLTYELLRASALLELQSLIGFFNARQGRFDSFLFSDPSDNNVTTHGFGVGDGVKTAFQLQRTLAGPRQADTWQGSFPTYTTPRINLLSFVEQFDNGAWNKNTSGAGSAPSVTPNVAVAPDGTTTADQVLFIAPGAGDSSIVSQTLTVVSGGQYAGSFFVRAATPSDVGTTILFRGVGGGAYTLVVLTASWQRVSAAEVAPSTAGQLDIGLRPSSGGTAGRVTLYLWGAQLEAGPSATSYIKSVAGPTIALPAYWPIAGDGFEPVFDVGGTPIIYRQDWQGNQQLYPTARTNGWSFAEQIDNGAWNKVNANVTVNNSGAPDANVTADKLTEASNFVGAFAGINRNTPAVTDNTTQAVSFFVAPAERSWVRVRFTNKSASLDTYFNAATGAFGTIGSGMTAQATRLAAGWYWVQLTAPSSSGGVTPNVEVNMTTGNNVTTYNGTTGSGLYVWGLQFEADQIACTSYIKTVATAVTLTDYTISATGLVTLATAPLLNAVLTWTGSYYWRVRFDLDQADFNNFLYQLWEAKQITLVSVK